MMTEIATLSLDLMTQPFVRLDGSGCVSAVNLAATGLFNIRKDRFVGREVARLIHAHDVTMLVNTMAKTKGAPEGSIDAKIRIPLRFDLPERLRFRAVVDVIADNPGWSLIIGEEIPDARKPDATVHSIDLSAVTGPAILFDSAGSILELTEKARRIFEIPAHGRQALRLSDLLDATLLDLLRDRITRFVDDADGRLLGDRFAGKAKRGGGETFDVSARIVLAGIGTEPRFIAHIQDLTADWALLDQVISHEQLLIGGVPKSGNPDTIPVGRCLIVSDDPIVTAEARTACLDAEVYPITCPSADTVVRSFDMVRPTITLFDYHSRDNSAPDALRRLAQESRYYRAFRPTVALMLPTDVSTTSSVVRRAKFSMVIPHPITTGRLKGKLKSLKVQATRSTDPRKQLS